MRFLRNIVFIVMFLGLAPVEAQAQSRFENQVQSTNRTLQVCTKSTTGEALTGDIELMLVMDNSKSLDVNDPAGKRFEQVQTMLESVHNRISNSRKPRAIRFSLITFAERATVVISQRDAVALSEANIKDVVERVRRAAPGNLSNTNYVNAIDSALDEMSGAAPQNCRVIVWFTDGAYWPANSVGGDSKNGGLLRETVCSPGGFADRIRNLNINIFPLYIEPKNTGDIEDPTASRDVMAFLTGHDKAFGRDPYQAGAPCADLPATQVGEVLSASNVNQLANFFNDLINIIEGGIAIACPTSDGRVESKPLPAGRYVAQISIVKYAASGKELTPRDLRATLAGGETQPLDRYFTGRDGRFDATDAARELPTGWKIEGSGDEHCIRAFSRNDLAVQIRKVGSIEKGSYEIVPIGPAKQWLEGEDLVSPASDDVAPVVRLGPTANCTTETGLTTDPSGLKQMFDLLQGQGKGLICVDAQGFEVFPRGIDLKIARDGQPLILCEEILVRRDGPDQFMTSERIEKSSQCEVDFRGSGTTFLRVTKTFSSGLISASGAASCNIDIAKSSIKAADNNGVVKFSLEIVLRENRPTKCNLLSEALSFEYQDTNGKPEKDEIPVSIRLNLQPEPDRAKALLATIATVVTLLAIALWVLRRMTIAAAALLSADRLWAVRLSGQAFRSDDGRTVLTVEGKQLKDVRIDMERVERARLQGREDRMTISDGGDSVSLLREMPSWRRMLGEPWAYIDDARPTAVYPRARRSPREQSLEAPFREALIALDDGPIEGKARVRGLSLWAVRMRGAAEGDQVAIEELLNAHLIPVVDELLDQVLAGVDEGNTVGDIGPDAPPPPSGTGSTGGAGSDGIPPPPDWS